MTDIDLNVIARRRELTTCLRTLHWDIEALASALNLQPNRVQRWFNKRHSAPNNVLEWLRRLADFHEAHRYPDNWWKTEPLPEITEEEEDDAS